MGLTALITGSQGAVADAIAAALASAGAAVRRVPVTADGALAPAPPGRADAVVHVGVRTPPALSEPLRERMAAAGATSAAALARAAGAGRLVHVSAAGVYGTPRNLPCREGELKRPRTAGERILWRAEQASWAAFRRGAPLTVLRPTILYGPGLRGGPVRVLSLVALLDRSGRRIPIVRRGPVAHLVHVDDLARAVVHVVSHADDRAVVGRAFNVGDDAPLPLAEHLANALAALGYETGRVLPALPRLAAVLLRVFGRVPDRAFLEPLNARLARAWSRRAEGAAISAALAPRIEREALHWMSADHYYDTSRLASLGFALRHPTSTGALAATIGGLVEARLLPGSGARALPAW